MKTWTYLHAINNSPQYNLLLPIMYLTYKNKHFVYITSICVWTIWHLCPAHNSKIGKTSFNPLPLLFKALLQGQKDCIFFSGHLINYNKSALERLGRHGTFKSRALWRLESTKLSYKLVAGWEVITPMVGLPPVASGMASGDSVSHWSTFLPIQTEHLYLHDLVSIILQCSN
jgi:hypothetical protein